MLLNFKLKAPAWEHFETFKRFECMKPKKSIRFYVRSWDGVELNCNMRGVIGSWGWSYLLFSMVGWAMRRGGGGERESEQKRSRCRYDAFCSALAGWKYDFFCQFMNTFYFVYWVYQCCYPAAYIQSKHLFAIMQYSTIVQPKILLFINL